MATVIKPNHPSSSPEPNFNLNTNEYLNQCDSKDVISFNNQKWVNIEKLKNIIYQSFDSAGISSIVQHIADISDFINTKNICSWFFQGEECEILRAGSKGWQKGKIKVNVTLEFIPDEPEDKSPLDDIRKAEINNIE